MFDAKTALKRLDQLPFASFRELREQLEAIRLEHMKELPAEFGPRELFEIARQNGWVREEEAGRIRLVLG